MGASGNGNGKFTPGLVAEVIALAGPGEEVPSGFAPFKQMLYPLKDGRAWYAALKTAVKYDNLELPIGAPFRVAKRPFGNGGSVIDVQRIGTSGPATGNRQPETETGTVLSAKLEASIAHAQRPRPEYSLPAELDPGDPGYDPSGERDRSTPFDEPRKPNPTPAPPALMTGQAQGRLACFCAAVDLLIAVEKYALLAGREVRFTAEDFRVCGNAWCIDNAKGGR